jgi:hypothetical protein
MLTKAERQLRPLPTLAELEEVEELGGRFFNEARAGQEPSHLGGRCLER